MQGAKSVLGNVLKIGPDQPLQNRLKTAESTENRPVGPNREPADFPKTVSFRVLDKKEKWEAFRRSVPPLNSHSLKQLSSPQNKNPSRLAVTSTATARRETLPSSFLSSPTPVYSNSSQLSLSQTKLSSPKKETLAYTSLHRRGKEGDSVAVRHAVAPSSFLSSPTPIHSNRSFFVKLSVRRLVYLFSSALLLPSIVVLVA
ncbi:uncharacterized protein DS421_14g466120 [Arachis hypogaea]|nr:uncharacterized protein DS421_14g466120 [Arachis hypogaea]